MPHLAAAKQATGEAVYCDDMPKYAGKSQWKKNRGKVTVCSSTSVLPMALWAVVLGAVHTRCSGTSAWVPAQNGVVFTL